VPRALDATPWRVEKQVVVLHDPVGNHEIGRNAVIHRAGALAPERRVEIADHPGQIEAEDRARAEGEIALPLQSGHDRGHVVADAEELEARASGAL
jgi:hypothetical protein